LIAEGLQQRSVQRRRLSISTYTTYTTYRS
jgi:hypothetical protein